MPKRKAVDDGFEVATPENIPVIDIGVLHDFYMKNAKYVSAEIRGTKNARSMRADYAADAVGYVQIKRTGLMCEIVALVTPEHRLSSAPYKVSMTVKETPEGNEIVDATCFDCAASAGGCKHALALISFIMKESFTPSVTSTECYWRKSTLSTALAGEWRASKSSITKSPTNFLQVYLARGTPGTLSIYEDTDAWGQPLSLHKLAFKYWMQNRDSPPTPTAFVAFVKTEMATPRCKAAESSTRLQSKSPAWKELRYGRITASILHAASRCQTSEGTLIETIMGAYHFPETSAIARGKRLEPQVLQEVKRSGVVSKISPAGLFLDSDYPMFGASPDAICNSTVLEVKCPYQAQTVKNYLPRNKLMSDACRAQLQLQMLLAKKTKGILCVADPDFENNKKVTTVELDFDKPYVESLIEKCVVLWEKSVFPKLMQFE